MYSCSTNPTKNNGLPKPKEVICDACNFLVFRTNIGITVSGGSRMTYQRLHSTKANSMNYHLQVLHASNKHTFSLQK